MNHQPPHQAVREKIELVTFTCPPYTAGEFGKYLQKSQIKHLQTDTFYGVQFMLLEHVCAIEWKLKNLDEILHTYLMNDIAI